MKSKRKTIVGCNCLVGETYDDDNYVSVDLDFFQGFYRSVDCFVDLLDTIHHRGIRDVILEPNHDILELLPRKRRLAGITVWNIDLHDDCAWGPRGSMLHIANWGTHIQREKARLIWIRPGNEGVECSDSKERSARASIAPRDTIVFDASDSRAFWWRNLPWNIKRVAVFISRPFFHDRKDLYALLWALFDKWQDLDRTINGKSLRDWSLLDFFNLVSSSTET